MFDNIGDSYLISPITVIDQAYYQYFLKKLHQFMQLKKHTKLIDAKMAMMIRTI